MQALLQKIPSTSPKENAFVLAVLAETGWGPPRVAIPEADSNFREAWWPIEREREQVLAGKGQNYTRSWHSVQCLAAMARSKDKRVRAHVKNRVDEIAKRLHDTGAEMRPKTYEYVFMKLWNTAIED